MFPVSADQEIDLINQHQRQLLADAERARTIRQYAASSDASISWRRTPSGAWQGLTSAVQRIVHLGGIRPLEIGGDGAAAQP